MIDGGIKASIPGGCSQVTTCSAWRVIDLSCIFPSNGTTNPVGRVGIPEAHVPASAYHRFRRSPSLVYRWPDCRGEFRLRLRDEYRAYAHDAQSHAQPRYRYNYAGGRSTAEGISVNFGSNAKSGAWLNPELDRLVGTSSEASEAC